MKIRTHEYAETAFACIDDVLNKHSSLESKYRTLALSFPSMVLQSGLAQAVAFLMAKGKDEHKLYLEHLARIVPNCQDYKALHQKIIASNLNEHIQLTRNVLDATSWLKRYTQANLKKDSAGGQS